MNPRTSFSGVIKNLDYATYYQQSRKGVEKKDTKINYSFVNKTVLEEANSEGIITITVLVYYMEAIESCSHSGIIKT